MSQTSKSITIKELREDERWEFTAMYYASEYPQGKVLMQPHEFNHVVFAKGSRVSRKNKAGSNAEFVYYTYERALSKLKRLNMDNPTFIDIPFKSNNVDTFVGDLKRFAIKLIEAKLNMSMHGSTKRALFESAQLCPENHKDRWSKDKDLESSLLRDYGWHRKVIYQHNRLMIAPVHSTYLYHPKMRDNKQTRAFHALYDSYQETKEL